jgi:hypothetical protein
MVLFSRRVPVTRSPVYLSVSPSSNSRAGRQPVAEVRCHAVCPGSPSRTLPRSSGRHIPQLEASRAFQRDLHNGDFSWRRVLQTESSSFQMLTSLDDAHSEILGTKYMKSTGFGLVRRDPAVSEEHICLSRNYMAFTTSIVTAVRT